MNKGFALAKIVVHATAYTVRANTHLAYRYRSTYTTLGVSFPNVIGVLSVLNHINAANSIIFAARLKLYELRLHVVISPG